MLIPVFLMLFLQMRAAGAFRTVLITGRVSSY